MSVNKSVKMMNFVNYRMKVQLTENRSLVGTFLSFDKHMNVVLGDTEEFRKIRSKKGKSEKTERRVLGLVLLRGENILQMTVEGPPVKNDSRAKTAAAAASVGPGPGMARAAGRGLPVDAVASQAPMGLSGPVKGIGGAAPQVMNPDASSAPQSYMAPPGVLGMPPPTGRFPPPPQQFNQMNRPQGPPPGFPGQMAPPRGFPNPNGPPGYRG